MAFSTKSDVQSYVNSEIISNGTNSITGAELNTSLNGILQFTVNTGSFTTNITASGVAFGSFTIPLTYTPVFTYAQATCDPSVHYFVVYNTAPTTNGIICYYQTAFTGTYSFTTNYIAI